MQSEDLGQGEADQRSGKSAGCVRLVLGFQGECQTVSHVEIAQESGL